MHCSHTGGHGASQVAVKAAACLFAGITRPSHMGQVSYGKWQMLRVVLGKWAECGCCD